jgi:hypothetical protein
VFVCLKDDKAGTDSEMQLGQSMIVGSQRGWEDVARFVEKKSK